MTSLLKKLSISIKIQVFKPLSSLVSFQMSTESISSRRELVANSVHTADGGVGGVYLALMLILINLEDVRNTVN